MIGAQAMAKRRGRRVRLSMATGVMARAAGALLQLVSLPIAAAALGTGGFVLYSMAIATLGWLMMANIGVGPAMGLSMAHSFGRDEPEAAANLLASAARITLALSMLVSAAVALPLWFKSDIAGSILPATTASANHGVLIAIIVGLFVIWSALSLAENAQIACQEQYAFDISTIAGTLVAATLVMVVARRAPSVDVVLLCAQGPVTIARMVNAGRFLSRHRDLLRGRFVPSVVRRLLRDGMAMSVSGAAANFLAHLLPILLFGSTMKAASAAALSAVMNAIILCASLFTILTTPLTTASAEAFAQGHMRWLRKGFEGALLLNGGLGLGVFVVFATAGGPLFALWYRGAVDPAPDELFWAGAYFAALAFEVTVHALARACGRITATALCMGLRAAVGALLMIWFRTTIDGADLFMIMTGATITFSVIPVAVLACKILRS